MREVRTHWQCRQCRTNRRRKMHVCTCGSQRFDEIHVIHERDPPTRSHFSVVRCGEDTGDEPPRET